MRLKRRCKTDLEMTRHDNGNKKGMEQWHAGALGKKPLQLELRKKSRPPHAAAGGPTAERFTLDSRDQRIHGRIIVKISEHS